MNLVTINFLSEDTLGIARNFANESENIIDCGVKVLESDYQLTLLVESQRDVIDILKLIILKINCRSL